MVTYLGPAIQRNFERWPVLGQYVWPNAFVGLTHKSEVNFLKNWIADRSEWLDLQWTYVCPAPPPPPVGSDEITDINSIKLYPNPAKDFLIVSGYFQGSYTISITDISGKILLQQSDQNLTQPTNISIDQLSSGIYFFNVKSNHYNFTTKFIKQ